MGLWDPKALDFILTGLDFYYLKTQEGENCWNGSFLPIRLITSFPKIKTVFEGLRHLKAENILPTGARKQGLLCAPQKRRAISKDSESRTRSGETWNRVCRPTRPKRRWLWLEMPKPRPGRCALCSWVGRKDASGTGRVEQSAWKWWRIWKGAYDVAFGWQVWDGLTKLSANSA